MPAFCLGAFLAPITMRLVRSGVIEVMNMDYIKTARAKGSTRGWSSSSTPSATPAFPSSPSSASSSASPRRGGGDGDRVRLAGVASLTVDAIRNQDFPVVQCAVLLALIIVVVNLTVDLVVGLIDPRVRVT